MDPLLRLLAESGPLGSLLLAGAGIGALATAWAAVSGGRRLHAPGPPRRAILVALACTLPLLLPVAGALLAIPHPGEDPLLAATAALQARLVAGTVGLILALPTCLAAGLWAGIAAGRRVQQAGQRARLSASAAGERAIGERAAAELERTALPSWGAGIGLLAALFAVGAPSLALFAAGLQGLEDLALARALGTGSGLVGALQAEAGAAILRHGADLGAAGAVATSLLVGAVLHAGSSRRRNLAVALRSTRGHPQAQAPVERALSASGRPGPWGPVALALLLAALAIFTWDHALRLRNEPPIGEALAHLSTG